MIEWFVACEVRRGVVGTQLTNFFDGVNAHAHPNSAELLPILLQLRDAVHPRWSDREVTHYLDRVREQIRAYPIDDPMRLSHYSGFKCF